MVDWMLLSAICSALQIVQYTGMHIINHSRIIFHSSFTSCYKANQHRSSPPEAVWGHENFCHTALINCELVYFTRSSCGLGEWGKFTLNTHCVYCDVLEIIINSLRVVFVLMCGPQEYRFSLGSVCLGDQIARFIMSNVVIRNNVRFCKRLSHASTILWSRSLRHSAPNTVWTIPMNLFVRVNQFTQSDSFWIGSFRLSNQESSLIEVCGTKVKVALLY